MRWYKQKPEEGDYVVVTITDVDKNSAYAELEEYQDITGLIHISEVSRSWIQDIRKEIDEGEKTVAQVIDTDDDSVDLSLKRVNDTHKRETMARWNKEQKAESFIEDLEEKLDLSKDELYEEVVFPMQKEFGSAFRGFEVSVGQEETLKQLFSDETVEAIQDVARENINLKKEKLEGEIKLEYDTGDGLKRIKDTFEEFDEAVEVKYLSAPQYSITAWGRNQELAKERMDEAVDRIRKKAEELGGEFSFKKA
ncbi:MAG: S1 RNA-binding domain-containing protein [Candidatus Nanohaloarchaea archaeon]